MRLDVDIQHTYIITMVKSIILGSLTSRIMSNPNANQEEEQEEEHKQQQLDSQAQSPIIIIPCKKKLCHVLGLMDGKVVADALDSKRMMVVVSSCWDMVVLAIISALMIFMGTIIADDSIMTTTTTSSTSSTAGASSEQLHHNIHPQWLPSILPITTTEGSTTTNMTMATKMFKLWSHSHLASNPVSGHKWQWKCWPWQP